MSRPDRDERGRFPPGHSGNPNGRGKGSRNKLGLAFIEALETDFNAHGKGAIEKVREAKPHEYLKVVASLLPREINYKDTTLDGLTDEQIRDGLANLRRFIARQHGDDTGAGVAPEDDPPASRH